MNEYYIIYETTNLINGKKYRGMHKTSNIEDGYLGSGYVFGLAVEKHGKENFNREILEYCSSYEDLIEKEKIYVDEDWVNNKSNYNLKTGGQSHGSLSRDSRKKLSETLKRKYANGEIISKNKGKSPRDETKKKISNTLKEKYKKEPHPSIGKTKSSGSWEKGHVTWCKGIKLGPQSEEQKKKKSEKLKELYKNKEHHRKGQSPWNKGLKGSQEAWNKGKKMEQVECPHCGKLSDISNGKRWHFDNCKKKREI